MSRGYISVDTTVEVDAEDLIDELEDLGYTVIKGREKGKAVFHPVTEAIEILEEQNCPVEIVDHIRDHFWLSLISPELKAQLFEVLKKDMAVKQ